MQSAAISLAKPTWINLEGMKQKEKKRIRKSDLGDMWSEKEKKGNKWKEVCFGEDIYLWAEGLEYLLVGFLLT